MPKWPPTGFVQISELAFPYFPNIMYKNSAIRKFRTVLKYFPEMKIEMQKAGYTEDMHELTPLLTSIVIKYWGRPSEAGLLLAAHPELRTRRLNRDKLFD